MYRLMRYMMISFIVIALSGCATIEKAQDPEGKEYVRSGVFAIDLLDAIVTGLR